MVIYKYFLRFFISEHTNTMPKAYQKSMLNLTLSRIIVLKKIATNNYIKVTYSLLKKIILKVF
jgi:hypothetical protein